jgi:hypothetical protein
MQTNPYKISERVKNCRNYEILKEIEAILDRDNL